MTQPPSTVERVLILGASSAIAEQAARLWAMRGAHLVLAARSAEKLDEIAADLNVRGTRRVATIAADLAADSVATVLGSALKTLGGFDVVLLAYGVLGTDAESVEDVLNANFVSATRWCLAVAAQLEQQHSGTLIVLGSVAGDRGRQSNYVYGATKAGLGVLVEGLAHRLARVGARAVLIKPGMTDTPMTAHMPKGPLWSPPEVVARTIVAAAVRGGPIVYAPSWWRWIMLVIRMVPSTLMHRTKL